MTADMVMMGIHTLLPSTDSHHPTGIQFWQPNPNPNPSTNPNPNLAIIGGGTATCQDCGNQAKKDCPHRRCRSCCKSRGFDCSTHVKSTWVPAARRRERHQLSATASKKPRLASSQTTASTSNTTPPRSFDATSSHQDASFRESLPRHVEAPAVFKCVRVSSVDTGVDEYAYQGTVSIGGHVFKGFLYNQGLDDEGQARIVSAGDVQNKTTDTIGPGDAGRRNGGASTSSGMLGQLEVFGGGLLGGTHYGNPMN